MQIDISPQDQAVIIKPASARVDVEVAGQFRSALLDVIDQGFRSLVVDMSNVSFIDSSGLGALVSALKRLKAQEQSGDIRLANGQEPVVELLEIIRLQRVFSSYPSVEQAVSSFSWS